LESHSGSSIPTDFGFSGKKRIHVIPQKKLHTLGISSAHVQEMSEFRTIEATIAAAMLPVLVLGLALASGLGLGLGIV
jgi:hypothetical protein